MPIGSQYSDDQQKRIHHSAVLSVVFALLFVILGSRIYYLQIIQGELHLRLSSENAMYLKVLHAPRGRVLDRNGKVLARNRPSYSIGVMPFQVKDKHEVISKLTSIRLKADTNAVFDSLILEKQFRLARSRRFQVTRIKEDVPLELVSIIEEHSSQLPGIVVDVESRREYPYSEQTFHVIGYTTEFSDREYDSLKQLGYQYGDKIGKTGIERQYEHLFRGKHGREYVEVNAFGRRLGRVQSIPREDPVAGQDVYLTLDVELQKVAYEAFPDSMRGAVVALDPRNGEVLCMVSFPSVDPNIFSLAAAKRSQNWAKVATDPQKPLNNRATIGTYTPGSTFKLVSAIALMDSGGFTGATHMPVACNGAYRIGRRVAHCWKLSGHGSLSLSEAVQKSCNVYFYQLGLKMGDSPINHFARKFGLGEKTGIDLPLERSGWLSGEDAHNRRFAERIKTDESWKWTKGLVLNVAIGQSQLTTPLQLALMVGGIGNAAYLYRPHLLKTVKNQEGFIVRTGEIEAYRTISMGENTTKDIHAAMAKVMKLGGTGGRAAVFGVEVGGKTGSAENPHGELTHALFVACAPVDNPEIAIAVVIENAGHGGSVAAPVAGEVLRYYFERRKQETVDGA